MALYQSGLGASVLVSLSPFFLGLNAASVSSRGAADLLVDVSSDVNAATTAPAASPMQSAVGEEPSPQSSVPPPVASAMGKEREEEDEIPVPVLADGAQVEQETEPGDASERPDADAGDDSPATTAGGDATTHGGNPPSSSSFKDQQDDIGGGSQEEAAGANTVGVA